MYVIFLPLQYFSSYNIKIQSLRLKDVRHIITFKKILWVMCLEKDAIKGKVVRGT